MAWQRHRKRLYYYVKSKLDGKVVSTYLGAGEMAQAFAAAAEAVKQARQARLERAHEIEAEWREMDETLHELETLTAALVRATLVTQGCHTHRGQWRRIRDAQAKRK